jgi:hypothetical protein
MCSCSPVIIRHTSHPLFEGTIRTLPAVSESRHWGVTCSKYIATLESRCSQTVNNAIYLSSDLEVKGSIHGNKYFLNSSILPVESDLSARSDVVGLRSESGPQTVQRLQVVQRTLLGLCSDWLGLTLDIWQSSQPKIVRGQS